MSDHEDAHSKYGVRICTSTRMVNACTWAHSSSRCVVSNVKAFLIIFCHSPCSASENASITDTLHQCQMMLTGCVCHGTWQDWVQDFKLWLTESPASSYFQELYPGTQVHAGFLEQFRAVTDQAKVGAIGLASPHQRVAPGHAFKKHTFGAASCSCSMLMKPQLVVATLQACTTGIYTLHEAA